MLGAMRNQIPHVPPPSKFAPASVSLSSSLVSVSSLSSSPRAPYLTIPSIPGTRPLPTTNPTTLRTPTLLDESRTLPSLLCANKRYATTRYSPSLPTIPENLHIEKVYQDADTTELSTSLSAFMTKLSSSPSRQTLSSSFNRLRSVLNSTPSNPVSPASVLGLWAANWVGRAQSPSGESSEAAYAYKKVANKTRPVATTLPENFRIVRTEHPDPLANLLPLPTHPPNFIPTG